MAEATSARKQKITRILICRLQAVVDGVACLVRQLKLDGPPRLLLPHRCAVHCITVWGNVLYPYSHDVTAAKLAIDGQIEQSKVTYSLLPIVIEF
jgi:hypothetical protein